MPVAVEKSVLSGGSDDLVEWQTGRGSSCRWLLVVSVVIVVVGFSAARPWHALSGVGSLYSKPKGN